MDTNMTRFIIFATLLIVQVAVDGFETVDVVEGGTAVLSEEFGIFDSEPRTSCELETNTGEKFTYNSLGTVHINNRTSPLSLNSDCTVTISNVKAIDSGIWTITYGNKFCWLSTFIVSVKQLSFELKLGTEGTLKFPFNATFCQLEDPEGAVLLAKSKSCDHAIPLVTPRHQGTWTARYLVPRQEELVVQFFAVTTYDAITIGSSVALTKDDKIQLLCRDYVVIWDSSYHYFIRPDGHILNENNGLQMSSYSYSANMQSNYYEWSLIIHKPKVYDYGNWKCMMGSEFRSDGSFAYVRPDILETNATHGSAINVTVSAKNMIVKEGDDLSIKCTVNASLSYCWFRGPKGRTYDVLQNPVSTELRLGECVLPSFRADRSLHEGNWSCNVGVINGTEERQTFSVRVTDDYIIPESPTVTLNPSSDTNVSCNILPSEKGAIDYCRWVNPTGNGIYNSMDDRYITSFNNTHCTLTFVYPFSQNHVNLGEWTCVAGVRRSRIEELATKITVSSH